MVVEHLIRETIRPRRPRRKTAVNWRRRLFDWLSENTSSLETASYDCISSYLLTLAPHLTNEDIEGELSFLATQGIIRKKQGPLGGQYWSMMQDWERSLCDSDEAPATAAVPEIQEPPSGLSEPIEEEVLDIEGMGDILDILKGNGLRQFVCHLLHKKGHSRVAEGASNPGNAALKEVWARTEGGAVLIAGCKGLGEIVRYADVEEVLVSAADFGEQESGCRVEVWMVGTGEWTPDAERVCLEKGVKVLKTLDLMQEAFANGILGIGVRRMRPYIARTGEKGMFLDTGKVKSSCGDPTQLLRIRK